jgi:RNA polymerase II subunit A C-terminal domain phosphatase SSU72
MEVDSGGRDATIALVCQSNMNRSMAAHKVLQDLGNYPNVYSYGVGSKVRLPGETKETPNEYEFGTPYTDILADLTAKNKAQYEKMGILEMLRRDVTIKNHPEKWQRENEVRFDLVFAFEKRVYDIIIADLENRPVYPNAMLRPVHVINIHTTDTTTEAVHGAEHCRDLVERICEHEDWENEVSGILDNFEARNKKHVHHAIMFYALSP